MGTEGASTAPELDPGSAERATPRWWHRSRGRQAHPHLPCGGRALQGCHCRDVWSTQEQSALRGPSEDRQERAGVRADADP